MVGGGDGGVYSFGEIDCWFSSAESISEQG